LEIPSLVFIRNLPSNGSDLARGLLEHIVTRDLEAKILPVAVQPKLNWLWYMQLSADITLLITPTIPYTSGSAC